VQLWSSRNLIANSKLIEHNIDPETATILYVLRGYGKKGKNSVVTPFKEFQVKRNDDLLKHELKLAEVMLEWSSTHEMPQGICHTNDDKPAKGCPVKKECFSGAHPEVLKWMS